MARRNEGGLSGPVAARRTVLSAALTAPLLSRTASVAADPGTGEPMVSSEQLMADIGAYAAAGNKQSGGAGDRWTANWVAARLTRLGFAVERQTFMVPWFEASQSSLALGGDRITLVPQPLVVTTPPTGLAGPLRLVESTGALDGAIAVIRLPHRRWSTITDAAIRAPIADAKARGAVAAILVTTGPTGNALLLNTPTDRPALDRPLCLLAPHDAAPVVEAARYGRTATLTLIGSGGSRAADNIVARHRRGDTARWLAVSTPRSGWTDCVGERGPGIAIWLALAQWSVRAFPRHNLLFVCNSGHEYENLGAGHVVEAFGPPPASTDLWLHLGANVATRDWHELPGLLLPLPSADPFRFLMTSPDLVDQARTVFKGQAGLEMVYPSNAGAAGELAEIVRAGYPRHAGIFGAHRHHHAASDTLSTIVADPLVATAHSCCDLLTAAVQAAR